MIFQIQLFLSHPNPCPNPTQVAVPPRRPHGFKKPGRAARKEFHAADVEVLKQPSEVQRCHVSTLSLTFVTTSTNRWPGTISASWQNPRAQLEHSASMYLTTSVCGPSHMPHCF